jgi:hypothetical protein
MNLKEKNSKQDNGSHFIELAGKAGEFFFPLYYYWSGSRFRSSKKLFGIFIQQLQSFESFLDDHGARLNKKWFYFS